MPEHQASRPKLLNHHSHAVHMRHRTTPNYWRPYNEARGQSRQARPNTQCRAWSNINFSFWDEPFHQTGSEHRPSLLARGRQSQPNKLDSTSHSLSLPDDRAYNDRLSGGEERKWAETSPK